MKKTYLALSCTAVLLTMHGTAVAQDCNSNTNIFGQNITDSTEIINIAET